jgi:hypothetical protein
LAQVDDRRPALPEPSHGAPRRLETDKPSVTASQMAHPFPPSSFQWRRSNGDEDRWTFPPLGPHAL